MRTLVFIQRVHIFEFHPPGFVIPERFRKKSLSPNNSMVSNHRLDAILRQINADDLSMPGNRKRILLHQFGQVGLRLGDCISSAILRKIGSRLIFGKPNSNAGLHHPAARIFKASSNGRLFWVASPALAGFDMGKC